jgi:hypothetical protein
VAGKLQRRVSDFDRWITLDKGIIAVLAPLQRIEFQVTPGRHEVSMQCFAAGSWRQAVVALDAVAGESYYLLIAPGAGNCAALASIEKPAGDEWIRRTSKVRVGP